MPPSRSPSPLTAGSLNKPFDSSSSRLNLPDSEVTVKLCSACRQPMYDDDRATNLATCIPCIVNIYSSSLALPDLREGLGEIPLALVSEMRVVLGSMAEGVGEVTLESLAAMDGALVREVRNVAIQRLSDASAGKDAEIERLRAADPSRPARSLDSAAAASLEAANATLLESAGAKDLEIAGYQEACAGKDRALGTYLAASRDATKEMLGKDQRIEKQRAQIAALRASSGESQRIVGDLDGEVASLRQQIAVESEGRERAVARRDAEIARLEGQAAAVSSTVAGKDAEIARLKERAAAVSREFAACVQQQRSYKALARCCVDVNPLDIVQDDPANRAALARDPNLLHAFVMDAGNQGIWETHRAAVEAASRNNIKREAVVKREAVAEREVEREAVAEEDIDEYL